MARALAEAWKTQTGGTSRCIRLEALLTAHEIVDPPFPVPGCLRVAERAERALLVAWTADFLREALDLDATRAAVGVDPTSNKIYTQLGYRRCGDWEEHEFTSA